MNNPTPEQIKQARTDAELTQTEAATFVYMTLRAWQQWEKGDRAMQPAFWELFLLKTAQKKQQAKRQEKETKVHEYDPWVAGWMLGKYEILQPWPTKTQSEEWLEGFKVGTTEVGEFDEWQKKLQGHNPPESLSGYNP